MKHDKVIKQAARLAEPFCVTKGGEFRLKDCDPLTQPGSKASNTRKTYSMHAKACSTTCRRNSTARPLGSPGRPPRSGRCRQGWGDQARHVGVNPQDALFSPSRRRHEELDHDYLWRAHKCVPERGRIGIFNRSYYEEVLIVRVHPTLLRAEKLPDK